ncbi:prepilin-type N-terminal cleavage/methylation domain-containing protein [Hydrogenivirga sp.]
MNRNKGFTLIELAIVLVIIGIIIGMVLKGQDLIQNARIKSFVNKVRAWETYVWIYFDRKGKFPGDDDRNGIIADETTSTSTVKQDLIGANFANPPYEGTTGSEINAITLGSNTFYVFLGHNGATPKKNVMVICVTNDCTGTFTQEQVAFAEGLDTSLDGTADGTQGQVICATSVSGVSSANWEVNPTSAISPATCDTSAVAVVYYFDAKR